MRALSFLLRALFLLVPLLILGGWGGSYLYACLETLAAPPYRVPIEFTYKARRGTVRLHADGYRLDLREGKLRLIGPKMQAPRGGSLARLDDLTVEGFGFFRAEDRVLRVRGRNLTARLVRLPGGRYEFEDLLPERRGTPARTPFTVDIHNSRVLLVDLAGKRPWRQRAISPLVRVSGAGDDWLATGSADLPGIGSVKARVQRMARQGIHVRASSEKGIELASALRHLADLPQGRQLQGFTAQSVRALGPVEVFVPEGGRNLRIESQVTASARGLRFKEFTADRVDFRGLLTTRGAVGETIATLGDVKANFNGSALWQGGIRLGGTADVRAASRASLPAWAARLLPKDVSFADARYRGWVAYGPERGVEAQGTLTAARASYQQEMIRNTVTDVRADRTRVAARVREGMYGQESARGLFSYRRDTGAVFGAVRAGSVDLGALARRFGVQGVEGQGSLVATVRGTQAKPFVTFTATGNAAYTPTGARRLNLGEFEAAATYRGGEVTLNRASLSGPLGALSVTGRVGEKGPLALDVTGRGVQAGALARAFGQEAEGNANFIARVTGTLRDPRVEGRAEGYNLTLADRAVPYAGLDFALNRHSATFKNLRGVQGAATLTGSGQVALNTGRLEGSLGVTGLQLEDFLGEEIAGALQASNVRVGGTLRQPTVTGRIEGRDLVVRGVRVESVEGFASIVGSTLRLQDTIARFAGGALHASGAYDTKTRTGTVSARADSLDLARLAPEIGIGATIDGRASGRATVRLRNGELALAEGNGTLTDVVLNETRVGSGHWSLGTDARVITGAIEVGQLDRYASFRNLRLDLETTALTGRADLFNFRAEDVVAATARYFPDLSPEARARLGSVAGNINIGSDLTGTLENPGFNAQTIEANDLRYGGQSFGRLEAQVSRSDGRWNIPSFRLAGPQGTFTLSGTAEEKGQVALNGELANLQLAVLGTVEPRLTGLAGQATVPFVVDGDMASPIVRASLSARGLFPDPTAQTDKEREERSLRIEIDTIGLSEYREGKGGLEASGNFFYRGFQGRIEGNVPFRYPFEFPHQAPANLRVAVARREIGEIEALIPAIDAGRTKGTVGGEFRATGPVNNLTLSGGVDIKADRLAFDNVDATLDGAVASLVLAGNRVALEVYGQGSRGGSLSASASTPVDDLRRLAEVVEGGRVLDLLNEPVQGEVRVSGLRVRQDLEGRAYGQGTMTGQVALGGTLRRPRLNGDIFIYDADGVIPSMGEQTEAARPPTVDPFFDLNIHFLDPAEFRTTGAEFALLGSGHVGGRLSRPQATADLSVRRGTITLPGGRVRVEPGGTVAMRYRATPDNVEASMNVDLEGRTAVTAEGASGDYRRYDVLLEVRGDLLKEEGLTLNARSEPGDLSQDRILALLGRADILESLAAGDRSDTEARLRSALAGYALPAVFDPLTTRLASSLGLEYLNIEYNPLDLATIAVGKQLGGGFSIQARRQIFESEPGLPIRYDLRLVYRPNFGPGIVRRFSLSAGTDQDRPWKVALEYGIRF